MKAREFDDDGYYDPKEDQQKLYLDDTRKPRLTFRHLNRLKKLQAAKQFDELKQADYLELMYGVPQEEEGPGGF